VCTATLNGRFQEQVFIPILGKFDERVLSKFAYKGTGYDAAPWWFACESHSRFTSAPPALSVQFSYPPLDVGVAHAKTRQHTPNPNTPAHAKGIPLYGREHKIYFMDRYDSA